MLKTTLRAEEEEEALSVGVLTLVTGADMLCPADAGFRANAVDDDAGAGGALGLRLRGSSVIAVGQAYMFSGLFPPSLYTLFGTGNCIMIRHA